MYSTCFYYGLNKDNFTKFSDKIYSLNSSARIIHFTNIYHLLSTLRVYDYLIENTNHTFPTHIFFNEKPGATNFNHFINAFERLRLEHHDIHEISLLPIFTKNDGAGDRDAVLELDYVFQYVEVENFEICQINASLN